MTPHPHNVAVLGPTGYTGLEVIEIVARHPTLRVAYLASHRDELPSLHEEHPRTIALLRPEVARCKRIDHDAIAESCSLAFLCLPHEAAMVHTPPLRARGVRVVDLSAAYRLRDKQLYESTYRHEHTDATGRESAVYGLTEYARDAVRDATLVANPGCYPTAGALALLPLLKDGLVEPESIIINASSGITGAGRSPKTGLLLAEAAGNYNAYACGDHRHQPEIHQTLRLHAGVSCERGPLFVPHLLPIKRGILETIYADPAGKADACAVTDCLRARYDDEPFVTVRDTMPHLRDVVGTNAVHLHATAADGRIVLFAVEDNLVKGAAGQAVQNANLMLGRPETEGLL